VTISVDRPFTYICVTYYEAFSRDAKAVYTSLFGIDAKKLYKMQFGDSLFFIVYLIAVIFSFVGVLILSKYRHMKEVKRLKEKLEKVMKDESAVWAE